MRLRPDLILNWGQYETHLDEAAFFWGQWERALTAPDEVLPEVAETEERLLARLDALVLGGERVAERLLKPALTSDEPERLCAAVFALLSGGWRWGAEVVLELLGEAGPDATAAIQRALEVLDAGALPAWLQSLPSHGAPLLRAVALEVLGAHAMAPGVPLASFVTAEPPVAAAALRAAARLRVRLEWPPLKQALASPEVSVRDAALVAALLSGHREAWRVCRESMRGPRPLLPLLLLSLGAGPGAVPLLREALQEPRLRPDALWALGFNGHVSAAEACLEHLSDEEVGHLAAEAFCAITGLVLTGPFVSAPARTDSEEQAEAPSGPGVHPPPGPGLPAPNPGALRAWWDEARKRLDPAVRYLRGRPWTPAGLLQALWTEPMRRRQPVALEVALRSQGAFHLRTRTFARHQLSALEVMRSAPPPLTSRPLAEGLLS